MDFKVRESLKRALDSVNGNSRDEVVHRVATLLKTSNTLGFQHVSRQMYGGGTSIMLFEPDENLVAEISFFF